jgi:hypothetical protein
MKGKEITLREALELLAKLAVGLVFITGVLMLLGHVWRAYGGVMAFITFAVIQVGIILVMLRYDKLPGHVQRTVFKVLAFIAIAALVYVSANGR